MKQIYRIITSYARTFSFSINFRTNFETNSNSLFDESGFQNNVLKISIDFIEPIFNNLFYLTRCYISDTKYLLGTDSFWEANFAGDLTFSWWGSSQ